MQFIQCSANGTADVDDLWIFKFKTFDDLDGQVDDALIVWNLTPCNRCKVFSSLFVELPLFNDYALPCELL